MSRYEQQASQKKLPILIILIVVISIISAIWVYQKNKQVTGKEIKPIDIPIAKLESDLKNEVQVDAAAKEGVNSEQAQVLDPTERLVIKPGLLEPGKSDDSFRKEVVEVSENLLDWFNVKDVIGKYILIINDLSQNQLLYKHRKFLKMPQVMVVEKDSQGLYMEKGSYSRYDRLANAIDAINVQKGLSFYLAFRPLFQQVYDEFAYPEEYRLEDIFLKAAASVIEAPIIKGRISLLRHSVRYKFADKKLEALNDVEKQMIRMGPENTKKIQDKLRQLVEAISVLNE